MAIDALPVWKSTMADLPKVADASWALNFANWVGDRVTNIAMNPSALDGSLTFVFNRPVFAAALVALPPTPDSLIGITGFALAWESAILTSIFPATLNVASGAKVGGNGSDPTKFSAVTNVILDPASILAGKAKILELVNAPKVADVADSVFPEKFRDAFLALKINVIGLDSVSPPGGPNPLAALQVPLI